MELNCTSEGGPRLDFRWKFSNITIDIDNATLNIDNVTVTNGVDYTCNVTNNAGFSSNTTTVYSELIKLLSRDNYLENYFSKYSLESYVCIITVNVLFVYVNSWSTLHY